MKPLDYVLNHDKDVLTFLRSKYPLYHMSNVFFRDVQYGIQQMFERKDVRIGYAEAEKIAKSFVEMLERKKVLIRIDRQSWVLNYEEFRTQPSRPAPAAKPAVRPATAAPGAAPVRPLPPPSGAKPAGAALAPPAGARPAGTPLPPPASAKPVGTPGALPPPTSARPAAQSGKLPPPTSAKPVASTLPPPTSAKPVSSTTTSPPAAGIDEGKNESQGQEG